MIAVIILSILICVCLFVIWNLLRKLENVEDSYRDVSLTNITLYETISSVVKDMRQIDDRGHFEADDEVGTVFKQLLEIVEDADKVMKGGQSE